MKKMLKFHWGTLASRKTDSTFTNKWLQSKQYFEFQKSTDNIFKQDTHAQEQIRMIHHANPKILPLS